MNIIIINTGSSSIKFQMITMPEQKAVCSGLIDRIGLGDSNLVYSTDQTKLEEVHPFENHKVALQKAAQLLVDPKVGVIKDTSEIQAVGHRVVHGGKKFHEPTLITSEVKKSIKDLFPLAPLHNPANLQGIEVAEEIFATAKQVAIFDTAFLHTLPEKAYKYAIPNKFEEEHNIRVYGFHGTSHKYVSEKASEFVGKKIAKMITIHLGNGCSMTAVKDGESIDHSMGFGPGNGLIMGTRSGDIDHQIIFHLNKLGYELDEINILLQKQSGMLGLTGYSDLRDIEAKAAEGDRECQMALEMNTYRIKKYIGAYTAALNGLDTIVFTAGIGENSSVIREAVCEEMDYFGIVIDKEKNQVRSKEVREIQKEGAKTKILVIPTNEELEIAKQVYSALN